MKISEMEVLDNLNGIVIPCVACTILVMNTMLTGPLELLSGLGFRWLKKEVIAQKEGRW